MRRIGSKDTNPEMVVRRLLHGLGYRYRLRGAKLPGRPDIVLAARRRVIFVHGCFWHQHIECREGRVPWSNVDYWAPKLERNRSRDTANETALRNAGWEIMVVWECETASREALRYKLAAFLGRSGRKPKAADSHKARR